MRRTLLLSITGKRNPANVHIACLSGQNRKTFPAHFPNSSAAALAAIASARRDQVLCKTLSFHCNF
jgi:hypothetical protein